MLLAVKTVKSDWCVSIRLLLVKKSVGLLLVKCLLFVCFVVVVNKSFVCKDLGLVPAGLRLKSPLNTKEAIQIVKATCRRLIRARINDCHRRLNFYNNKLQQRLDKLKQLIPTNLLDTVLAIADKRADKTEEQHRNQSQQKLTRLQRTKDKKNDTRQTTTGSGIFLPVL